MCWPERCWAARLASHPSSRSHPTVSSERRVAHRILLIRGTRGEYIIRAKPVVGSGENRGCRTLWFVRVRVLTFPRPGLSSMRNPLQRKLVGHPKDCPWSSWSYYEKGEPGIIAIHTLREK